MKYGRLSNHLLQGAQKHGRWRDLVLINSYRKQCLPVITWNKNHLSKQVVIITYTVEKNIFAVAVLKVWESPFLSERVKKDL